MKMLFRLLFLMSLYGYGQVNRPLLYEALQGGDTNLINTRIEKLNGISSPKTGAFEGALYMKKAGLVNKPAYKLLLFKKGRTLLEEAFLADEKNTEYHFLRLLIQENAPKMLNYHNDIEKDSEYIRAHFDNLSPELKVIVKKYAKTSKMLKGL